MSFCRKLNKTPPSRFSGKDMGMGSRWCGYGAAMRAKSMSKKPPALPREELHSVEHSYHGAWQ
jgi:hypothetical protein